MLGPTSREHVQHGACFAWSLPFWPYFWDWKDSNPLNPIDSAVGQEILRWSPGESSLRFWSSLIGVNPPGDLFRMWLFWSALIGIAIAVWSCLGWAGSQCCSAMDERQSYLSFSGSGWLRQLLHGMTGFCIAVAALQDHDSSAVLWVWVGLAILLGLSGCVAAGWLLWKWKDAPKLVVEWIEATSVSSPAFHDHLSRLVHQRNLL